MSNPKWWSSLMGLFSDKNPLDSIFEGIDKLTVQKDEKEKLRQEAIRLELDHRRLEVEDRTNARTMYKYDSGLQKFFAVIFLAGYMVISYFILKWMFDGLVLDQVASNFLFTIFGAMSTKVNTIIDFLFGGSISSSQEKDGNFDKRFNKK